MREIVRDYSRLGDLVCDPCCGAGTTGLAALHEGRRFVMGDMDAAHVEIARKRLVAFAAQPRLPGVPVVAEQLALTGDTAE